MSLYLGENLISGSKPINLGVRNIGEIVASPLPLTDAGLHLLDGSLILGGGIYQGFVDYIADLYTENPSANYFTTEADWQTAVTTYGVCGKFVYDSVNNTVRLPKITGIIEGTTDITALGDLVQAGLPSIEHTHTYTKHYSLQGRYTAEWANGCYSETSATTSVNSAVNPIYGKSNTVQPQTVKAFYYIVIATSTKTDIQVDIDEIATDLNGKADVDLSNTTPAISFATAMNTAGIRTVVETYVNGTSWYRVYSDGWCEQGGYQTSGTESLITVTMLQTYTDTNYTLIAQISNTISSTSSSAAQYRFVGGVDKISGSQFKMMQSDFARGWYAAGYIR